MTADEGFREDLDFDSDVTEAVGRASEALEYVERARGHLYSFHQLIGHADIVFGEAADLLRKAGEAEAGDEIGRDVVGRNVIDGRWTFQVVEEFDRLFHQPVTEAVRGLERDLQGGHRHVFEARMKEDRRTAGRPGHDHRPPSAHDPGLETDDDRDG